jgi:hypothetical protein
LSALALVYISNVLRKSDSVSGMTFWAASLNVSEALKSADDGFAEELVRFPLFATMKFPRPGT